MAWFFFQFHQIFDSEKVYNIYKNEYSTECALIITVYLFSNSIYIRIMKKTIAILINPLIDIGKDLTM